MADGTRAPEERSASAHAATLDALLTPIFRAFLDDLPGTAATWVAQRRNTPYLVDHSGPRLFDRVAVYDTTTLPEVAQTVSIVAQPGMIDNPLPVWPLDADVTHALALATQALVDRWESWWVDNATTWTTEAADAVRETVRIATFWGAKQDTGDAIADPVARIGHDGIASVAQVLAHGGLDVLGEYDDARLCFVDILDGGAPTELALRLNLNVIGPVSVQGLTFPRPMLVRTADGAVFSETFLGWLRHEKRLNARRLRTVMPLDHALAGTSAAGAGCPVALDSLRGERTVIDDIGGVLVDGFATCREGVAREGSPIVQRPAPADR